MTRVKRELISRFSGAGEGTLEGALFLPDLTLWYEWHHDRGTLPEGWRDYSLPQVARALGVPVWFPVQPYRVETPGVEIVTTETQGERVIRSETAVGTLTARWTFGPDGDWWQTEYPVKAAGDLGGILELVEARTYVLDAGPLSDLTALVGDEGVLALELPRRPYSDLLHEFLGWSEGLLLLSRAQAIVERILTVLESKLQRLVEEVAQLPGQVVLSPDNLDGQFISPRAFEAHLADSYRRSAEVLHGQGKGLVVHVGGPVRHILGPLGEVGVDAVEGIAGPPQSDLSLAEARRVAGPDVTLWGGIPQDFLLAAHEPSRFEAAVTQAVRQARGDRRVILGIADRVPVEAELDRLRAIPALVEQVLDE